ncbi:MBL fold metallo-hydrolase [Spirosoma gilvum]
MNPSLTNSATITKVEKGPYTIHSYLSPESAEMVCSQIVETPSALMIVDVQLLKEQAQAVRDYANSLGKPINKVLISHFHPDHWAGWESFADVPICTLPEIVYEIQNYGQMVLYSKKPAFGDAVTSNVLAAQPLLVESETVDGLEIVYHKNTGTESTISLMVELPQLNVLIAQDLVYNGVYPYIGDRSYITGETCFDNWIKTLEGVKAKGYDTILPGHGLPADSGVCDTLIDTLSFCKSVFETAADGAELKRRIMEKYPDYKVVDMLDLAAFSLYNTNNA